MPLSTWLHRTRANTLNLMFPLRCLACECDLDIAESSVPFCGDCRREISLLTEPLCPRCASPVPAASGAKLPCSQCKRRRPRYDRAIVLGHYQGLLRDLVLRMKTDSRGLLAHSLVQLALETRAEELMALQADQIVPIPTHFLRELKRGANAPRSLAAALARQLGKPGNERLLKRRSNTPQQTGLSEAARLRNLRGEILVRSRLVRPDAHLLVVDDVVTTGATCNEAAKVLKRAGIAKVSLFAIARTPDSA